MKSKLNYLIGVSLKRKIKTKWFLVANIILAIVVVGGLNIDSVIKFFGGDFNDQQTIYVIDSTDTAYNIFTEQMKSTQVLIGEDESYQIELFDGTLEEAKTILEEEEKANSIVIVFAESEEYALDATIVTKEYLDMVNTQTINTAIHNTKTVLAVNVSHLSEEELTRLMSPIAIKREFLDENKNSVDENMEMIMTTVFPLIIMPFFLLTIFLVQMIGAEVNDEKTTRGMEIIISNVSPRTHFASKIIAGNLFILIQGAFLIGFAGIGLGIRRLISGSSLLEGLGSTLSGVFDNLMSTELMSKMIYIIPLALLLMLLTFLAYSLLAAVLASMTTNIEDFQQLQTPIMIVSLVGYYLAMMAGMFDGALFIRVLSYVPFISAILSPSLLVLGQIGISDVLIALILMIGTNYVLIKYGLKIYKVGILNYSSKDLWKKMFKAMKEN